MMSKQKKNDRRASNYFKNNVNLNANNRNNNKLIEDQISCSTTAATNSTLLA